MCGIIGYIGNENDDAAQKIISGLKNLEYRGYDSWGVALLPQRTKDKGPSNGKLIIEKHVGKISNGFNSELITYNSSLAIGHTRWATHGGVSQKNAHPHIDCTATIAVVHNGIIENFQKLKKELIEKNHHFKSETDTEIIPHLIEEYNGNNFVTATKKAFLKLKGRNAFVALSLKDDLMVGLRDGSPLIFGIGDGEYFLASDVPAFLKHTRKVIFLDDKSGVVTKNGGFEIFDLLKNKNLTPKVEKVSWTIDQSQKGKYRHFLAKEIQEQPKTILAATAQNQKGIAKLAKMISEAFGSYLVGCGTASYAALFGTYAFSQIAGKHINFAIGSEFGDYQHFLTPKSLVIAVSQSGETADILEAIEIAKQNRTKTVAIVNVVGSTLARNVDYPIFTNAGPEIAVVSTKAFTAQLSVLLLLAHATAGRYRQGKLLIEKTASKIGEILDQSFQKNIAQIANQLKDKKHIYVIGKGQNYPIALEAALKIKEASYIHGEGFAAGELKHGVIALIEKGTPAIVLFGNDQDRDYSISSAMEMKARGGYIIGIGPDENEVFDQFIKLPDIPEASAIINTLPVQLLAYYLAVEKGLDPDKPRNLAKSVTVK